MSFYTNGWFGPYCPLTIPPSIFGGQASFNVHDFDNPAPPPQPIGGRVNFPLDVAMKMCWEANQYIINSSITSPVSGTNTVNLSVTWGSVYDFSGFFIPRPNLETAKEMLCVMGGTAGQEGEWTTLYRENVYSFAMPFRPSIYQGVLSYQLGWTHNHPTSAGSGLSLSTVISENNIGSFIIEQFQLLTPWGNFSVPYRRLPVVGSSSSLSITVTAANPQGRYA
jgi:hypothetical protein